MSFRVGMGGVNPKTGEMWIQLNFGGGGFGEPFERDPEMVLRREINESVCADSARQYHYVLIDEERMKIDSRGTAILRRRRR